MNSESLPDWLSSEFLLLTQQVAKSRHSVNIGLMKELTKGLSFGLTIST